MKEIDINGYIKLAFCIMTLYIFYNVVGIGCPIRFLTGISCAGCGMTRAWICLLHLDIRGAFYYHPLFIMPAIYLFIFIFKNKISKSTFNFLIIIGIGLFIATYIFRLLNPDDIVVNINIKNGFIYKLFEFILS
ncbi:DUF2752 domain-containing protein [Clostridium beijerinckii]|uniref:DUF2752 domain-containing protein n=1 Tax=Clostridium beijerinckii TaxID=1520 RepID=A0AAX0B2M9_CLOBE|nr:DUF2752 domain-containing protein [Clostridium beijerinckii]MBA8936508.1 hypothetical protein [Clostridium beijerinckii]NRT89446.1 hypothetical protein [Clostridium beijerinckii]NRU41024.1 hypothetical protein [Clostridium beijerinckii]NSA95701.1 hypothetical protein [Clostridium beijerinckii]NYC74902.1 hypothetical protein [Clostridium beijerinckii]